MKSLKRAFFGEEGSVTIEFAILFPMIMYLFFSSFEVSIYLAREVMLERSLDINVRDVRLGDLDPSTQEELRTRVCDDALIFSDCPDSIMIELTEVETDTWDLPDAGVTCVDRTADEITPALFGTGGQNSLMVVRACAVMDPFFPTTSLVMDMPLDSSGGYSLVAVSTFVNEP